MSKYSETLRACRKFAGLTQSQLGERLYLLPSSISQWERDLNIPSVENYERILNACGFGIEVVRLEDIEGRDRNADGERRE